jgi:hypothetical protein
MQPIVDWTLKPLDQQLDRSLIVTACFPEKLELDKEMRRLQPLD